MEERYSKVYTQERNLYIDGSPIIVLAGALHKDNITEKLVAQLKFQSLVESEIVSVYVELLLLDKQNQATEEIASHTFEKLSVKPGEIFGAKDPIIISDGNITSFKLVRIKVLFANAMFWENETGHWEKLPNDEFIHEKVDKELFEQHKIDNPQSEDIYPVEWLDLWRCSCGSWNKSEKCTKCGNTKLSVLESVDKTILIKHIEDRKAEREKKEKRKKEMFRFGGIAAVACIGILTIAQVYSRVLMPNMKYREAQEAYESQDYEQAITLLEELDGYKDTVELLKEVKYNQALYLYNEGKLDESIDVLNEIPDYEDSKAKIVEIEQERQYLNAIEQYESGDYDAASNIFKSFGNYKQATYYYGMSQYKLNEWEEAKEILIQIPESDEQYSAAQEAIKKCDEELAQIKAKESYDHGIMYMKNGHLNTAIGYFQNSNNYENAKEYIDRINDVLDEGYVGVYKIEDDDDEDKYLGIYAMIDPEQAEIQYSFVFQDAVREEEIKMIGDVTGETVVIYDTFENKEQSMSERHLLTDSVYHFQPDQSVYSTHHDVATLGGAYQIDRKVTLTKSENGLQVEERATGFNFRDKEEYDITRTYSYKRIGDLD